MPRMRKWLARLSFSFIAIAGVCAWEAYQGAHAPGRQVLLAVGAAVATGIGLAGIRERARQVREAMAPRDQDASQSRRGL
jgi:drug/metabolite transporter (DMT)-like permease